MCRALIATLVAFVLLAQPLDAAQTVSEQPVVAVVGLSRTGTSSITAALRELNYTVLHSEDTLQKHLGTWAAFMRGDTPVPDFATLLKDDLDGGAGLALADCWYTLVIPELAQAFPNAKFILSTRDEDKWIKSYQNYIQSSDLYHMSRQWHRVLASKISRALNLGPMLRSFGLIADKGGLNLEELDDLMYVWYRVDDITYGDHTPELSERIWRRKWKQHHEYVRSIIPADRLLEFDASKQGWEDLNTFLYGTEAAKTMQKGRFPHVYAGKQVSGGGVSGMSRKSTATHELYVLAAVAFLVAIVGAIACMVLMGKELKLRVWVWARLLREYPSLRKVFFDHEASGFFIYGAPGSFSDLGSHPATAKLLALRPGRGKCESQLSFVDDGSVLPTYLPVEHGAAASSGAAALAAAELLEMRGGAPQKVVTTRASSGLATAAYLSLKVAPGGGDGGYKGCDGFAETIAAETRVNPVRRAYECKDGKFIFLHGGFPKLKAGILSFLGNVPCTVKDIAAACAEWDSSELESAMQAAGLAATVCRTPAEWRSHEQGKAVAAEPTVSIAVNSGVGSVPPALAPRAARPLSDVIVVDFSHVIASPVVGRTLVDHGATVFKIVSRHRPRRALFDEEANAGKNTLELQLDDEKDRERLWSLLKVADVLIDGYTDGVLAGHGFGREAVLNKCPHLVHCAVACYGHSGPMAGRKGFQQNANFCSGVAAVEDENLLGYQLVSQIDYATGFLGAYGIISGLQARQLAALNQEPIRGVEVKVSLCATSTWMAEFGASCPSPVEFMKRITRLIFFTDKLAVTAGNLTHLKPPVLMSGTPTARVAGFNRWWNDAPEYAGPFSMNGKANGVSNGVNGSSVVKRVNGTAAH